MNSASWSMSGLARVLGYKARRKLSSGTAGFGSGLSGIPRYSAHVRSQGALWTGLTCERSYTQQLGRAVVS